ncbi:hypothetical protein P3C29_02115 [Pseudomonas sp. 1912-s]|uniref:hypothetical protein n=1 Tax=Pseudomonas sp. 1912-s TaxID=3033802 RepID=UPI0023E007F0|nr:hypothetical protein [Pseudomonas sp. 1912-s]MDF3197464.1 hypothetical protein [Pseudomonas sp. 1912-s]
MTMTMTEFELASLLHDLYSKREYDHKIYRDNYTVHHSFSFKLPNHNSFIKVFEAAQTIFPDDDNALSARSYTNQDGNLELVRIFKIPFRYDFLYKGKAKGKYLTNSANAELLLALRKYNAKAQLSSDHRNSVHRAIENLIADLSEFFKKLGGKLKKNTKDDPYL